MTKKLLIEDRAYKVRILRKYYALVGVNSSKARSLIRQLNYANDPYLLRCIALTYFDESRLNEDNTEKRYFNKRKLRLAEKYIIKAYILNENCIDVLYTLGEIRNGLGQKDLAIYCFRRIIEIGARKIPARDICTDRALAKIKINDSRFQLYRLYFDIGNSQLSRRYLSYYKKGIANKIETLFTPLNKYLME